MRTTFGWFRIGILVALGWSVSALGAAPSDLELADLWARGDLSAMSQIAEKGDVRAQQWMGLMLRNHGQYRESIGWYQRAVDGGDGYSAGQIADFHQHGIGVPENKVEAVKWLRKGALLGDSSSQRQYASALRTGQHVHRDAAQAFRWYLAAARQRDSYAYFPLAEMAAEGEGTQQDVIKAYAFARAAEETGDSSETGPAISLRRDLADKLAPAERARAEHMFARLRPDIVERETMRNQKLLEIVAFALGLLLGAIAIRLHIRRKSRILHG